MWICFAFGSAFFAGLTAILAKCGIKQINSTLATAIRTIIVLFFSWGMVFLVGSQTTISTVDAKTWLFLILSGLATGASWLCYYKALQLGDVNQVTPIDKSSTVLTILLAAPLLGEPIGWGKGLAILLIAIGTYWMIQPPKSASKNQTSGKAWLIYAALSALFASLTAILGKIGISGIESNLGTAIRTGVVLLMAWSIVCFTGKQREIRNIEKKN